MNPLSQIYGSVTKAIGGLWSRWGGQGWSKIRTFLPSAKIDWEKEAGDTWRNSIVALSIAWLGDRFPRPMVNLSKIARNGDYVPLGRHPIIDLWKRPNPFYSRRTMEKAIGLSLKVEGDAYIHKVRDRMGRVVELWWIPHFQILPTWPMDGSVFSDGYLVQVDGDVYRIPREDVIHIQDGVDPENTRCGLSALKSCLREVVTLNREASYTAAILKNMGIPGMVIAPENEKLQPTAADSQKIKETFKERFGIENDMAGSTAVLAGQYKVTALGFSPEQMALDRLPLNAIGRISAAMGVAAMSVGLPDPGKTYSNLGEANKSSWGTVQSIQELISEAISRDLFPEFDLDPAAFIFEYDYSNIQELQEPLDAVHTRAREDFKYGLCMLNEAREMIGLEPDPEGDRYMPQTGSPADLEMMKEATSIETDSSANGAANGSNGDEVVKGWHLPFLNRLKDSMDEMEFIGDYSQPPHPAEYPATLGGFDAYLADCKGFPDLEVIDSPIDWATKYNHCHGRNGRFCHGSPGVRAGGSYSPLPSRAGGGGAAPTAVGGGGSAAPAKPAEPAKPEPTKPTGYVKPSWATKPVEPAAPAKPAAPIKPTKPAANNGTAVKPAEPAKPTGYVKPSWAKPAEPAAPAKPTAPSKPAKPGGPAQPATPSHVGPHTGRDMAGQSDHVIEQEHGKMGSEFKNSLSVKERNSLVTYTGKDYTDINGGLRKPPPNEKSEKTIKSLDKALGKAKLKEDTIVYRGVEHLEKLGITHKTAVGSVIKDPAYMSTSLNPKVAMGFAGGEKGAILRIKAPKGSKGGSVGGMTKFPDEHEILFPRGTGIRITGKRTVGSRTYYDAEIVAA